MSEIERSEFKRIFDLYYSRLVVFAGKFLDNSNDAEDCVLESFTSLWKNKEKLKDPENVKSYLYTSVRNKCLNVIRHNKVLKQVDISEVHDIMDETSVELSIIDSELHSILSRAIQNLPEDARQVLELNVFEKVKMHEIAERMDISLNQVKALKTKALKELKKELGDNFLIISIILGIV